MNFYWASLRSLLLAMSYHLADVRKMVTDIGLALLVLLPI
jgi:hypothetical protein